VQKTAGLVRVALSQMGMGAASAATVSALRGSSASLCFSGGLQKCNMRLGERHSTLQREACFLLECTSAGRAVASQLK